MRVAVVLSLVFAACGGPKAPDDPVGNQVAPSPPVERVELGRCATGHVPFVSGSRLSSVDDEPAVGLSGSSGGLPSASSDVDLDRGVIRQVIRAQITPIRNCYERELLVNPTLAGTVTTRFTINPDGSVSGVAAAGLDPAVDSCVAGVIAKLKFPSPKGGGYVNVSYPFNFQTADDSGTKPPPSAPPETAAPPPATAKTPAPPTTPAEARARAIEQARRAGVLGVLSGGLETRPTPLANVRAALAACASKHLSAGPGGAGNEVMVIDLEPGAPPRAHSGSGHRDLEACAVEAAGSVAATEPLRCPLALGRDETPALTHIAVTGAATVWFAGEELGALIAEGGERLRERLQTHRGRMIAKGFSPPVARLDPLELRAPGDAPFGLALEVIAAAEAAELHVELAVPDRGGWRQIRGGELPWVPVPAHATVDHGPRVDVTVESDLSIALWRRGSAAQTKTVTGAGAVVSTLEAWKGAGALDGSIAIRVLAGGDRRVSEVAAVVDAIERAGYQNWSLGAR